MKRLLNMKALQYLGLLTQLGITIVASILIGFFIGYYLDKWFRTGIIMTIIFLVSGVIAGFLNVYKIVKGLEDKKKG